MTPGCCRSRHAGGPVSSRARPCLHRSDSLASMPPYRRPPPPPWPAARPARAGARARPCTGRRCATADPTLSVGEPCAALRKLPGTSRKGRARAQRRRAQPATACKASVDKPHQPAWRRAPRRCAPGDSPPGPRGPGAERPDVAHALAVKCAKQSKQRRRHSLTDWRGRERATSSSSSDRLLIASAYSASTISTASARASPQGSSPMWSIWTPLKTNELGGGCMRQALLAAYTSRGGGENPRRRSRCLPRCCQGEA